MSRTKLSLFLSASWACFSTHSTTQVALKAMSINFSQFTRRVLLNRTEKYRTIFLFFYNWCSIAVFNHCDCFLTFLVCPNFFNRFNPSLSWEAFFSRCQLDTNIYLFRTFVGTFERCTPHPTRSTSNNWTINERWQGAKCSISYQHSYTLTIDRSLFSLFLFPLSLSLPRFLRHSHSPSVFISFQVS